MEGKENKMPAKEELVGDCLATPNRRLKRLEFDFEMKPVEHPAEPKNSDQPVKFPDWNFPFLHGRRMLKEELELIEEVDVKRVPTKLPVQSTINRYQNLTCEPSDTAPSFKSSRSNIFQVFHQCKGFEF